MADIFSQAAAVCVYCPISGCNHADSSCEWGKRLWTLSEIINTDTVITMTRRRAEEDHPWEYDFVEQKGRTFRAEMQRQAELKREWHLAAIMRHSNNGGSMTWQHSIHALVFEAIRRNRIGGYSNTHLAKALNGLLPRRAEPKDLTGKDGWADMAWLLELNQGFYNPASLAAVCSLGETTVQGHGWLGPPIEPSAGNERLQPLVTAFPIKEGLFLMDPVIIGLRPDLERDPNGMSRNEKLRALAYISTASIPIFLMWAFIPPFIIPFKPGMGPTVWMLFWVWFGFALSAVLLLIGGTLHVKKSGVILLRKKVLNGQTPAEYLGTKDAELAVLSHWGKEQLVPQWPAGLQSGTEEVTLVDLMSRIQSKFNVRNWEGKEPNALVPLAIHGCGVTCLVLHHHDDPFEPAIKLGIVNMPPYILVLGMKVGSMVVGAVPDEATPPPREISALDKYIATARQGYPPQTDNRYRTVSESTSIARDPYGSRVGLTPPVENSMYPPTPTSEQGWSPYGSRVALNQPTGNYLPSNNSAYNGSFGQRRF